jgi:poly-gamma-glutamate synthesis protein (capsule biosynthesis protein)
MSLANNHYFDLGVDGQLESPRVLSEAGLFAIGASRSEPPFLRVETLEVQGWRIGFIAFATRQNSTGAPGGPKLPFLSLHQLDDEVIPLVDASRADHDLLIVEVHWGDEYVDDPGRSRRVAAQQLLDAGVDLLIGHHPHVLQAIELHESGDERDGLIAYSLGNFLFPRGDHPPGLSGVLRVRYRELPNARPCLEQARLHPIISKRIPRWHPEAATDFAAAKVRERVVPLSRATGTRWVREGELSDPARGEDLLLTGLRGCTSAHEGE